MSDTPKLQEAADGGCPPAPCSALFVNAPPILEVRDYVTAHGYGVTARFDFTDVPAKYHGDMLMLIRLGGYHLARPANDPPKPSSEGKVSFVEALERKVYRDMGVPESLYPPQLFRGDPASDSTEANRAAGGDCPRTPCCASLIVHDPSDLPKCDGEILVALWGAGEWEIVNVRENINGPFAAEYKSTGELADPSEWQWWADLHCMILHNDRAMTPATESDHGK